MNIVLDQTVDMKAKTDIGMVVRSATAAAAAACVLMRAAVAADSKEYECVQQLCLQPAGQ